MSVQELAAVAEELPDSLKQYVEETEEKTEPPPEKVADEVAIEQETTDPLVEKAKQGGWRPKEDWTGDPDEWVDHAEFVRRKPLFDKIHSLSKALKDKDAKIDAVSKHATKAFEAGRERAIKELEEQRRKAVEVGDVEAFDEVEKQLQEARKDPEPEVDLKVEPEIPPVIQDFSKRNDKWFEKDEDMTDYALARAKKYTEQGLTLDVALEKVDVDVRRAFPHKFVNPNKEKPAAVGSNNTETRAKSYSYGDLNAEQRNVWASLKKAPGYTFDQYVADLKAQGDLK
jgi:hypothetical protein